MQRSPCNRRCSNHFADRLNRRTGFDASRTAHVGIDGHTALGGETEHINHFQPRCSGCVLNAHPNRQATRIEFRSQALAYRFDLFRRGRLIGGRPALGQNLGCTSVVSNDLGRQRRAEHRSPRRHMAGRRPVVNQRAPFLGFQKLGNIRRTDLQLKRRSYAVQRLDPLACHILAVLVQIDEARSNNQPAGMNHPPSAQRLRRNANNLPIAYADVARRIQPGLGIHHSTTLKNQIVLLRCQEC